MSSLGIFWLQPLQTISIQFQLSSTFINQICIIYSQDSHEDKLYNNSNLEKNK